MELWAMMCSVQLSHSITSDSLWLPGLQHARLPCPSPTPRTCSNSCPASSCPSKRSSSIVSFSSCLQIFPASGSFTVSSSHQVAKVLELHPRRTGHGAEFWKNMVHWRREWQTILAFLSSELHKQYEKEGKKKRYGTDRGTPHVSRCPISYWRRAEKYLQKEWRAWAKAQTMPTCEYEWWWM